YVDSVVSNDQSRAATIENDWAKNADEIATYLSKINPYLDKAVLQNLLINQLGMTKDEILRRISNQYVADIYQYDFIEYHALMIADIIWSGLISQFYR
ncbi:MAG: acetylglutamate kinase, partial [Anaerocolumna sp.]|nr:acetylglutamate kinase [Anaerocolumna sp.]